MEEATERLVKLFLESESYLVRTNKKYKIAKNNYPQIDIIAMQTGKHKGVLPKKIIGEVKSYGITPAHLGKKFLEKHGLKQRDDSNRLKIVSNSFYRKRVLGKVEEEYGKGFKYVIFAHGIQKKREEEIKQELQKKDIQLMELKTIIKGLIPYSKKQGYTGEPELQLIKLIEENK